MWEEDTMSKLSKLKQQRLQLKDIGWRFINLSTDNKISVTKALNEIKELRYILNGIKETLEIEEGINDNKENKSKEETTTRKS